MNRVTVTGSFDDLKSRHMRLLQEAARRGPVHVLLWADQTVQAVTGHPPKFPLAEREYFVQAIRFVDRVSVIGDVGNQDALPAEQAGETDAWVMDASENNSTRQTFCETYGLELCAIGETDLTGFPDEVQEGATAEPSGKKKVIVTGCYDWFHSGHVRFFEEVSELGDLYVVVGHDKNIELLKGEGHPMYHEGMRRYMAGAIRYVKRALVSSGDGWLDAEPEMERLKPDIYAVNEDGDRPVKRAYCQAHGIEYRVLERRPKEGLPKRQSTDLRGF